MLPYLVSVGVASSVYWTPNDVPELYVIFTADSEIRTVTTPFPYEEVEAHVPLRGKQQGLTPSLALFPHCHYSKPCFWMRLANAEEFPISVTVTAVPRDAEGTVSRGGWYLARCLAGWSGSAAPGWFT